MYKNLIFGLSIIILVMVIMISVIFINDLTYSSSNNNVEAEEPINIEINKTDKSHEGFGEHVSTQYVDDNFIASHMHWMSHQKVDADDKWGYEIITEGRIQWLIDAVDKTEMDLEHEAMYLEILKKWQNNNFSEADEDHNRIWESQGGYIGKAKGIYTPEEEYRMLKNMNFDDCYTCTRD